MPVFWHHLLQPPFLKEEVIEEEEATDDASEADSGVDPGQDDQVNLSD